MVQRPAGSGAEGPSVSIDQDTLVVAGGLHVGAEQRLEQGLRSLEERNLRVLVVDLRQVTSVDSTGLAVLVRAKRRAERDGRQVALVRAPRLDRLLQVAGLEGYFDFVDGPL